MLFQKSIMSPHDKKMQEYANSQILNQQTMIEYIAVMSDIDLPTDDNTQTTGLDGIADIDE